MSQIIIRLICLFLLLAGLMPLSAQRLQVAENGRFLVTETGDPFFWLGDTAWELFHRCDREEADMYLETRAEQGFTVIHAVALAEIDGLHTPNPYGETPLINDDPGQPNTAYFQHVDHIIDKAEELGLYIALLPTWGDKLFTNTWGIGPEIFTPENARAYGQWIGNRYRDRDNIIWVIGGDRNPREGSQDVEVWRALAAGVAEGAGGNDKALMTFHPQPKQDGGSSTWFHHDEWLDLNMHQTGHCPNQGTYLHIMHDYDLEPVKPVLDGEPLYEDHPNCFRPEELGHSVPEDIRRIMYGNVFAGAFGQSYGCHDVWQMWQEGRDPINKPLRPWKVALDLPMARQVKHLKNLMLSRPFLTRIPDQKLIAEVQDPEAFETFVLGTRDETGRFAMVYIPDGRPVLLDLSSLSGENLDTWWFDPRTGAAFEQGTVKKGTRIRFDPPSQGKGNDWVLVIDGERENFGKPGS